MSNSCCVGNNYFINQGEKQWLLTIVKFYYEGMIHFSKNVPLHFGSHPVTHLMDNKPAEQKFKCKDMVNRNMVNRNSPQKSTSFRQQIISRRIRTASGNLLGSTWTSFQHFTTV